MSIVPENMHGEYGPNIRIIYVYYNIGHSD